MFSYTCNECSEKFSGESMEEIVSKLRAHYFELHGEEVPEEELRERINQ